MVLEAKVLLERRLQEAWIPWGPGTARGTLVSIVLIVALWPMVSAKLIYGGDDVGPITRRAQGEHASPWTLALGPLPFCIVECVVHGTVIS